MKFVEIIGLDIYFIYEKLVLKIFREKKLFKETTIYKFFLGNLFWLEFLILFDHFKVFYSILFNQRL